MSRFGKPWSITDLQKVAKPIPAQPAAKENRKIKNAKKVTAHGLKFDSKLELYTWEKLTEAKIPFEFQREFILVEGFLYRGKKVRPMIKIVDFWLPEYDLILESKGWRNDVYPLKEKLLKLALKVRYGIEPDMRTPSKQKEVDAIVLELLSKTRI